MEQLVRPHPITGAPMLPVGYTRKGRAVWPVAGGSTPAGDPAASGASTTSTGTGTPAAGTATTTTGTAGSTTDTSGAKLVPQDQVDAIVESRLARERAKYADHDDLKAKAAELDTLKAANASDLDKAVSAAKKDTEKEVTARFQGILRASAVREAAAGLKYRDSGDALAQLQVAGKLDTISVDPQGNVDMEAVKRELGTLATSKPYLLAEPVKEEKPPPATPAQAGVGGSTSTAGATSTTPGLTGQARMRAAYEKIGTGGQQ